jgi:hypothetical protein
MSIRDEINAHVEVRKLFGLGPAIKGEEIKRDLIVSAEVLSMTASENWSMHDAYRLSKARGDLDRYSAGRRISVMPYPKPWPATTYLKRLDPVTAELWEIRSCDPKPGIRVLGRFADKNLFVALCWDFHEFLKGETWDPLCDRCLDEWRKLFPNRGAHGGTNAYDFVSEEVLPV